jgi:hypothetical protein
MVRKRELLQILFGKTTKYKYNRGEIKAAVCGRSYPLRDATLTRRSSDNLKPIKNI